MEPKLKFENYCLRNNDLSLHGTFHLAKYLLVALFREFFGSEIVTLEMLID